MTSDSTYSAYTVTEKAVARLVGSCATTTDEYALTMSEDVSTMRVRSKECQEGSCSRRSLDTPVGYFCEEHLRVQLVRLEAHYPWIPWYAEFVAAHGDQSQDLQRIRDERATRQMQRNRREREKAIKALKKIEHILRQS